MKYDMGMNIGIVVTALLGALLPWFIITAVKTDDEEKVKTYRMMSCIIGFLLFLSIGMLINS